MHHYDQSAFTADEADEQLEEEVNSEGFVNVSERIDPEGDSYGKKANP